MAGPGLARALTELALCLAGIVSEVGRAAQVMDGVTDSACVDGARLGDEAFRNNSLGFIVEGIELLISAADEGLTSAAAAHHLPLHTYAYQPVPYLPPHPQPARHPQLGWNFPNVQMSWDKCANEFPTSANGLSCNGFVSGSTNSAASGRGLWPRGSMGDAAKASRGAQKLVMGA